MADENPLAGLGDNKLIDYAYALRAYAYKKGNDNQTQNRYFGYYIEIQNELERRKQLSNRKRLNHNITKAGENAKSQDNINESKDTKKL